MSASSTKQVILYRRDLKMRKGKIAAQCAHASMKVLLDRAVTHDGPSNEVRLSLTPEMAQWVGGRFTKVVLSVEDEAALLLALDEARRRGVPAALITDAGLTEFHGQPTRTTVAIGPANNEDIDAITGPQGVVPTRLA